MHKSNELEAILARNKQRQNNHLDAIRFGLFTSKEDVWALLERSEKESNEDIKQINKLIGK